MLAKMSSLELSEWIAFNELEPFGSETQYLGHAITSTVIANVNRQKGKKAYVPEDFMPKFKKPQTLEEQIMMARLLTEAFSQNPDAIPEPP